MQVILHKHGAEEQYLVFLTQADPGNRHIAASRGLTFTDWNLDNNDTVYAGDKLEYRAFVSAIEATEGSMVPMVIGPRPCCPDQSPLPEPDEDGDYDADSDEDDDLDDDDFEDEDFEDDGDPWPDHERDCPCLSCRINRKAEDGDHRREVMIDNRLTEGVL